VREAIVSFVTHISTNVSTFRLLPLRYKLFGFYLLPLQIRRIYW